MARAAGFNVGVDAHIDPQPRATNLYVEWDGVNMTFPHSSGCGGEPTWRDDVGIVPYISVRPRTIQPGMLKPSGCGRLVAAHTVHIIFTQAIVVAFCKKSLQFRHPGAMMAPKQMLEANSMNASFVAARFSFYYYYFFAIKK